MFSHFTPSSYEQYSLDGGIYGVPETQTFNVLFYRRDVLDELGLESIDEVENIEFSLNIITDDFDIRSTDPIVLQFQ